MAKIDEASLVPDATVGTRGVMVVHRTRRGAYVHKWPRKRGKWATPGDFYRQQEFGWVARGVASPQPTMLATAINYAKGSDQVPRDILMMAAYGLLYEITFTDGTPVEYYRMVAPNAQLILDQVTDTHGALMYRSPLGWIEIPPSDNGDVLAMLDQVPTWLPGFIPLPGNPVGPQFQPYFRDPDIYLTNAATSGGAHVALAAGGNVQYLVPIMLNKDRTLTSMAFHNSTAVALSNARMAIYNVSDTDGGPTTVIVDTGNISTAATGIKQTAISETLPAGPYFVGLWLSSALTIRALSPGFTLAALGTQFTNIPTTPCPYISRSAAFGTAWPDFTSTTFNASAGAGNTPLLGVR